MALTRPRAYQIYDIDYKQAVRVVTVSNITLSGGAPNSVDGVNLSLNDRILVTGQSNSVQNGIYYVTTLGTGANGTWTRSIDTDATGELLSGTIVMVTEGTTYADTQWKLTTDDPITIGVSSLTFVQNYLANSVSYGGTSFAVNSSNANATISVSAVSNVVVVAPTNATFAANILPSANITYDLGSTTNRWKDIWLSNSTIYLGNVALSASADQLTVGSSNVVTSTPSGNINAAGDIVGANILTSGLISATGNITSAANVIGGNILTSGIVSSTGNITGANLVTAGTSYSKDISATGNAYINGFISVVGNLYVANVVSQGNLTVEDPLLYLTANAPYPYNYDIGLYSQFQTSPGDPTQANGYQHTGFVRDQTDGIWKLFSNVVPEPTATINFTNAVYDVFLAGGVSSTGNITATSNIAGGNVLTSGQVSATGNVTGSYIIGNGSQLTGLPASYSNTNVSSFLAAFGSNTISTTGTVTAGNITGGNLLTGGLISSTGNVTGGNILTAGIASVTGTISVAGNVNSTAIAIGNGAVNNVAIGFFPTSGTAAAMAIRDYSTVASTMYFDVGMGGTSAGTFSFRTTNSFSTVMVANTAGITTPGRVYGLELNSTQSSGDEGGQINLSLPATNTTLAGPVVIDVYQNRLRFYEGGGTARGAYIDLTAASAGVGSNLLAGGGGGGTPGGSNTNVQFNDAGSFGGNGQFTYDKVTNTLTAGIVSANNNGAGTNFKVGDDAWIGDINTADTIGIKGQQNPANAYIVFGNSDATGKLGRAGTGPLTYAGAFSATGNVTGGNILTAGIISATGNVSGGNVAAATAIFSLGTVGASGNITSSANISGGNLLATTTVSAASHIGATVSITGTMTAASTVGGVITGTSVSASGNITSAANIAGGNVLATTIVSGASHIGSIVSVTGNVSSGNLTLSGTTIVGPMTSNDPNQRLTFKTSTASSYSVLQVAPSNTSAQFAGFAAFNKSDTGNAGYGFYAIDPVNAYVEIGASGTGTQPSAFNINIPGAGATKFSVTSAGNTSVIGNLVVSANIVSSGSNATANIGSATTYFNTVHAKATSAQYADVAEKYVSDYAYPPGTVVEFGGDQEVTVTVISHSTCIAGVVSTNPAYIMNAGAKGDAVVELALLGRVPCSVVGNISKGDRLVSSDIPGVARKLDSDLYQPGCIIGKALENYNSDAVGVIEVVVGRL